MTPTITALGLMVTDMTEILLLTDLF